MALYAETGCHVAKRPRVEFPPQTQQQIHAHAAAAQQAAAVQAAAALQLAAATASVPAVSAAAVPTGAPAAAVPQQNLNQNHSNNVTLTPAGHGSTVTSAITPSSSLGGGGGGGGGILSQHYIEQQLNRKSHEPEKPNHILLFTVLNPTYPITCEVLHTICSPVGTVNRIVIFKKNGVQAMVEFDKVDTARNAKEALHGCDIYSGCCTLKIEYAKPTKLNVYKNDSDSWDYTNPNLGSGKGQQSADGQQGGGASTAISQRPVLLKEPIRLPTPNGTQAAAAGIPSSVVTTQALVNGALQNTLLAADHSFMAAAQSHQAVTSNNNNLAGLELLTSSPAAAAALLRGTAAATMPSAGTTQSITAASAAAAAAAAAGTSATTQQGTGAPSYQHHQGAVCMVYGLCLEKMNPNRIFNLFCLYGNVVRVKFLKTKEGCAMVQMGDGLAVERVVSNLNNSTFFGSKMQLGFSKQAFLADVQSPYQLPDGSNSFQDFMGSKNNRFINPEMASKNRIQPPSKILHFFNTPPGLESSDIDSIFVSNGSPKPKCVKMFPSKTERSSSGLIEFETLNDALEGLVVCNHQPIPNPNGKFPYIMKLCFSRKVALASRPQIHFGQF